MDKRPIITLLTDFGTRDHYVASMKGVILGISPQCTLIDITHEVRPQDIEEGAFNLANAYSHFPKGTIHVAVVDPGVGGPRKPVLLVTRNYFLVGPDNGLLSLAAQADRVKQAIELTNPKFFLPRISATFHGRDIFYAIGASDGYIYVRAEYPKAIDRLNIATAQAEERGFLGDGILGTPFRFNSKLKEGAGAFVCGEETALIMSVEGKRAMPRVRPPFPATKGLWDCPTCINNVETFAIVPWIVQNGATAFNSLGTKNSKGTKVFAMAGKVKRGGLVEVPMGISIAGIVHDICGGIQDDKKFKAVQMGGPSGGCIPAELQDIVIDYESINKTGAIMGSGGLVVMDETTCMVDIARFFLDFTQHESCGKCTFCRVGTKRMLEILSRITEGKGKGPRATRTSSPCAC